MRSSLVLSMLAVALVAQEARAEAPATLVIEALGDKPLTVTVGDSDDHVGATCETPCRLSIAAGSYVVTGKARGILSTRTRVTVPPAGVRVTLRADRKSARVWGIILTSFGGASALMGSVMVGAAAVSGIDDSYNRFFAAVGGVLIATGLGTGIPGVLLLKNNHGGIASSSLDASESRPDAQPLPAAQGLVPRLTFQF